MASNNIDKLYQILDAFEKLGKNKREIKKIRGLIEKNKIPEALEKIRELNNAKEETTVETTPKKRKKAIVEEEEKNEETEQEEVKEEESIEQEDDENIETEEDNQEDENYDEEDESIDNDSEEETEVIEDDENEAEYSNDYKDNYYEGTNDETYNWDNKKGNVVYKEETKKKESIYPVKLQDEELEEIYIGMLLDNPKLITKYYILFEECYFDDQNLLNIYKSILFTEGGKFTPEIAKKGFNFSVDNSETYKKKAELREKAEREEYNPEEIYLELRKLCVLRKSYIEEPREEIQNQIVDIRDYELYDQMSPDEIKAAIIQVSVTQKFKQSVLSEDLTGFLEKGENNLTNGLELPFPILSSVFKGIRKGETMAFAMPSNSGKSRFTINIATYTAFVHRKKVLIISNEMSEEKMKLCLITTVLNNPEIQKLHGQKISKTEGELLEFKFRPDKGAKVEVDENGFVLQKEKETRQEFVKRLQEVSTEFNQTIAVTDWINNQINNSIYFINITDHTNDELKKVIMNYYYKEKIEYVFYDTLKTDTANIGNGEEIKRTATILSNLAQNFNMFICSTLQLTESQTLPINLDVNDLAVSRTVKEVLDTLCLIKQIPRDELSKYKYSLKEVDTKFLELKKYDDPDERYYACVVDKNRAGAKPKLVFNLNLAYNRWNELGYLSLSQ